MKVRQPYSSLVASLHARACIQYLVLRYQRVLNLFKEYFRLVIYPLGNLIFHHELFGHVLRAYTIELLTLNYGLSLDGDRDGRVYLLLVDMVLDYLFGRSLRGGFKALFP